LRYAVFNRATALVFFRIIAIFFRVVTVESALARCRSWRRERLRTARRPLPSGGLVFVVRLSRRSLFRASGGASLSLLGSLGVGVGTARPVAARPAAAYVPPSRRFDLTRPSYDLFRGVRLHNVSVQQSFAFDQVNRVMYTVQRRDGSTSASGDLCITRLNFNGTKLGYMYLNGFGHGVAMGAEGTGSGTYLWTETRARSNGYGAAIARFRFTNGRTISPGSSGVRVFDIGRTGIVPTIDPINNRLCLRYTQDGAKHYAVHSLERAGSGDFDAPLARFRQPALDTLSDTFQGYALYGRYVYCFTGTSYEGGGGAVTSQVTAVNVNTGRVVQGPVLTRAGAALTHREPEGLAIYRTAAGATRLFLGFASGDIGDRRSNIFYKDVLV
jgi:hypothetical protein